MKITTERTMELDLEKDKNFIKHQLDLFFHENKDNLEKKEEIREPKISHLMTNSVTGESYWEDFTFSKELIYVIQPKDLLPLQLGDIRKITFIDMSNRKFELEFCTTQITSQADPYSESEVINNKYKKYVVSDNGKHSELYKHLMTKYLIMLEQMKERKNKGE